MSSTRLLIVSNRLPVTAHTGETGVGLAPASGGLAAGLRPWHERTAGLWIGWPGDVSKCTAEQRLDLDRQLDEHRIVPIHLSRSQIDGYYHGFCNRVLWPLFHYLIDRMPVDAAGWDAYREVNEAFSDAVAREHRSGDTIWVHDYHLMLLRGLLRKRLPDARIGFFLHVPFPSSEVFRILPWRREVLDGLLGADLVGFHTFAYMRHFVTSLLHVEGVEADIDRVRLADREVKLGVFPKLDGALVVNPYDVDAVATSINRALSMPIGERRARMKGLRRSVTEHDINAWADGFLAQLDMVPPFEGKPEVMRPEPSLITALADAPTHQKRPSVVGL